MLDKRRHRACTRFVITLTDKQRFLSFVPANERSGAAGTCQAVFISWFI